jgi:hypothetical protein
MGSISQISGNKSAVGRIRSNGTDDFFKRNREPMVDMIVRRLRIKFIDTNPYFNSGSSAKISSGLKFAPPFQTKLILSKLQRISGLLL